MKIEVIKKGSSLETDHNRLQLGAKGKSTIIRYIYSNQNVDDGNDGNFCYFGGCPQSDVMMNEQIQYDEPSKGQAVAT